MVQSSPDGGVREGRQRRFSFPRREISSTTAAQRRANPTAQSTRRARRGVFIAGLTLAGLGAAVLPGTSNAVELHSAAGVELTVQTAGPDPISEQHVDLAALLGPGAAARPLQVTELDASGAVVGGPYPAQFDADAVGADTGSLIFMLPGGEAGPRRVRLATAADGFALQAAGDPVQLETNATDEGKDAFKITTPRATWYFLKAGGAFSSAVDPAGNDWIGYHPPPSGFDGQYRGIGQLTDDWFHPGGFLATTTLVSSGALKVTLEARAVVATGTWVQRVEIYPTFVRSTFTQTGSGPWWFLYEGSPGGDNYIKNGGTGVVTRADGQSFPLSAAWDSNMSGPNWVNFALPSQNRSIFFAHNTNDGSESSQIMGGSMVVFGFGRAYGPGGQGLTGGPKTFTYGILPTANASAAASQIATILSSNDGSIDTGGGSTGSTASTASTTSTTAANSTTSTTPPSTTRPSTPTTVVGGQGSPATGFRPVTPARLLDTREAGQGPAMTANVKRSLAVRGVAGVPADAEAVVLNVTATNASEATFVRAWATGAAMPRTSSLNVGAGDTVPNLVTSSVGSGGTVDLMVSDGTADLVVDVVGYYASTVTNGGYHPVNPVRALDTRNGAGVALGPNGTVDVDVAAALGINSANVAAVAMNVTVTSPSAGGYVSVYPATGNVPTVSNLNFAAGQTVANAVTVGASSGVNGQ